MFLLINHPIHLRRDNDLRLHPHPLLRLRNHHSNLHRHSTRNGLSDNHPRSPRNRNQRSNQHSQDRCSSHSHIPPHDRIRHTRHHKRHLPRNHCRSRPFLRPH